MVVSITVLAAVLRVVFLTSQSFWFDEAQAVHEMRSSFGAMLHLWSANEPNPPLFFVIAWPWARVFGTGEAGLRSLSVLLGTITVPLVYLCGRELVSRRAGQIAALLVAVNPFLIGYSQEAREYMLLTALSAASVLFFARAWRTGSRRDAACWAVFAALAMGTQYFAGFLVAAEAIALLVRRRSPAVVLGCVLLVVVEGALIPHLIGHAAHPQGWIGSVNPLGVRAKQVPVTFALNTMFKGPALSYSLLGGAIAVIVVLGLLLAGATQAQLRGAGIAAGLLAVVVVVPLLVALAGRDYYEPRALIGAMIPLLVLVGAACAAPRARVAGTAVAIVLVAGFLYGDAVVHWGSPAYREPDWRGVATALGPSPAPRAIVAYDGQFATPSLAIYLPRVAWTGQRQNPQPDDASVTTRELDVVGSRYTAVTRPLPSGVGLISERLIDGFRVVRFALPNTTTATRRQFIGLAGSLLGPPPQSGVRALIQSGSASVAH